MSAKNESKYFLIAENSEGIGAIHRQALNHMAYATALDALGVSSYLTSDQITKYASKKTTLKYNGQEIEFEISVPIRRDLNAYDLVLQAQTDVRQRFAEFLSMDVTKVNIIIDQVFIENEQAV
jgi:uncharacterized alkaline shock family protein YloU